MKPICLLAWMTLAGFGVALGEVKPSALFGDHAVLQSGMAVPVWGTAEAGEAIAVTLAGQTEHTTAGANGRWMVRLKTLKAGGPFEMTIAGRNTVTVHDVLVGEVWVGSGQSNMAFTVSKKVASYAGLVNEEQEIASADYPRIRVFMATTRKSYTPVEEIGGEWKVCTPANVPAFSAVSYLFARDLQRELKVPVGMLVVAFGASTAEAWVERGALVNDPALKPTVDRFDALETFYTSHQGAAMDQLPAGVAPPQTINGKVGTGPLKDPVQDQHQPTVLFNGMVHPILPYAMRGVLWYQGESIVGGKAGVALYPHVIETLVRDWRKLWGEGNFPFYAVQLAALDNVSNNPAIREAQARILLLPKTGLAVTIDIGDKKDVHPHDKTLLGERLTKIALAGAYGRKVEFSGPVYESAAVEGEAVRLRFSHATGGLVAHGGVLKGFQVAGANGVFVEADAAIAGDTLVVRSESVKAPVAVRYAWANYPAGANLYNGDGLPAAPFRTDDWDVLTPVAAQFTGR